MSIRTLPNGTNFRGEPRRAKRAFANSPESRTALEAASKSGPWDSDISVESGAPTCFAAVDIDVFDRKRRKEALPDRDAMSELQAIYEAAPVGLCVLSLDLRWVRINAKMAETNGIAGRGPHRPQRLRAHARHRRSGGCGGAPRRSKRARASAERFPAKRQRDPACGEPGRSPIGRSEIRPGASRRSW